MLLVGENVTPVMQTAIGPTTGTNLYFTTKSPYVRGSTVVFLNGFALTKGGANGWEELPPNRIKFNEAPLKGDVVQVYYLPM